MEPMKNFCGLIPESIHMRVMADKGPEMTNGEYLTKVFTAHLDQPTTAKQDQRTLAVQISEDMFQQLKSYLDAHSPLTQKALVQNLLNQALDQWEQGEEPLQDATLQDNKKERTLAIAMPETLFQRVEQYLEAHNGVSKWAWCRRNSDPGSWNNMRAKRRSRTKRKIKSLTWSRMNRALG